jgi:hypothetical protein
MDDHKTLSVVFLDSLLSRLLIFFISPSPDHEVVKVSFSDGAMSGVRRRGPFVVNNWVVNSLAVTVLTGSSSNFVRIFVF